MKKNMGSIDRIVRVIIAAILIVLSLAGVVSGTLSYILLAASGIFLLTSLIGFCPLYTICGLNSCKIKRTA